MSEARLTGLLISDFTADNLRAVLARDEAEPAVELRSAPFASVVPTLAADGGAWEGAEFAVVWTRPEEVVPSFGQVLRFQEVEEARITAEVDAFADLLLQAAGRVRFTLVPAWVKRRSHRGLGLLELGHPRGVTRTLDRMNARLAERLDGSSVHLLDARPWFEAAGAGGHDPRLWYMAKNPYGPRVYLEAATDLKAALRALTGRARKLVVVDLDDTMWGGILGEVGWQGLKLGGHDPIGEAHAEFQRALKALTHRGVILALASKNDEATALEAIRSHPEMVLRLEDFAGWRINWEDKARNIADLVASLNLGLDAAVFLDDNPAERGRVREALPQVMVPEWPTSPLLYASTLESLPWFDTAQLSMEDAERARLYSAERERSQLRDSLGSLDSWLRTLEIRIQVEPLNDANRQRAAQLLNKTNQMNLSTRRLTEAELVEWASAEGNRFWTFRMSDRFSDSGLTGLLGVTLEDDGATLRIVDWVLSCRVMGRRMEETMLHVAVEHARALGADRVVAEHRPTERNRPCLEFWQTKSGFDASGEGHTFLWEVEKAYPAPAAVTLEQEVAVP